MRIKVKAFGCKLNQCEAGAIESALCRAGHEMAAKPPFDIVIVCGCTVTVHADYKVRQYLRRMARDYGVGRLILSGCSGVSFSEKTVSELGIEKVFTKNDPKEIVEYIGAEGKSNSQKSTFHGRTRGYVKIQDGCDQFCTYCIVPLVRGRERSVSPENIVERIHRLSEAGVKEAVLTGVHDGRYNYRGLDLSGLLRKILDKTDIERIRLSSIECTRITKKLVDIISSERRIAPHLHVPLQSGNNAVLKRMGRNYSREKFASTIENFAQKVEDVGIGADIIVGFPGETDHEFEESVDLINSLPITYLHVFRYSPRPGTAAAEMPDQVHNETKRERMEILRALHEKLREKFAKSQFGKTRRVIIESVKKDFGYGWTGNYMRAEFPIDSNKKNKMILVKPISYSNGIINCRTIDSI